MDYLTKYYKNLSEQLQQKLNHLQNLLAEESESNKEELARINRDRREEGKPTFKTLDAALKHYEEEDQRARRKKLKENRDFDDDERGEVERVRQKRPAASTIEAVHAHNEELDNFLQEIDSKPGLLQPGEKSKKIEEYMKRARMLRDRAQGQGHEGLIIHPKTGHIGAAAVDWTIPQMQRDGRPDVEFRPITRETTPREQRNQGSASKFYWTVEATPQERESRTYAKMMGFE